MRAAKIQDGGAQRVLTCETLQPCANCGQEGPDEDHPRVGPGQVRHHQPASDTLSISVSKTQDRVSWHEQAKRQQDNTRRTGEGQLALTSEKTDSSRTTQEAQNKVNWR